MMTTMVVFNTITIPPLPLPLFHFVWACVSTENIVCILDISPTNTPFYFFSFLGFYHFIVYLFRCGFFLSRFVRFIHTPFLLFGITSLVYAWKSNTSESVSSLSVEVFVCVCRFRLHAFDSFTLFQTNGDALFLHITMVGFGPKHTHPLCFYLDTILFLDVNLFLFCAFYSFFLSFTAN